MKNSERISMLEQQIGVLCDRIYKLEDIILRRPDPNKPIIRPWKETPQEWPPNPPPVTCIWPTAVFVR